MTNRPGTSSEQPDPAGEPPAWSGEALAHPHAVADKAARVQRMFAAIAQSYDLNNRLHSLGMDQHWRNVAVKMAAVRPTDIVIDVACGTGNLSLKFAQKLWWEFTLEGGRRFARQPVGNVIGLDFTFAMLLLAKAKGLRSVDQSVTPPRVGRPSTMDDTITWINGDAMALPLPSASADIVSIAFGIRNVADWGKAIDEFARVLRPGGRLVVLEFSLPTNPVLRGLYNFYFRRIMPATATWISGDRTGAYRYLPESVNTFISREAMVARMAAAGFADIVARPLTFGVCVCYRGVRK